MKSPLRAICTVALLVLYILFYGVRAAFAAPTLDQCVSASEDAEKLRRESSLRAARASFLQCVDPACPRLVRDECNQRLTEVDKAMPTLVFDVHDNDADATEVTVSMDGATLVSGLDGKPVAVDPGEHTFAFKLKEYPEQTKKVVVREGEKGRAVAVQFGTPKPVLEGRLVVTAAATTTIVIDGRDPISGGRFDAPVTAGGHEVHVTEPGKAPFTRFVAVKVGETQTLAIVLEDEKKKSSLVPWIIGGGAAVVVAAIIVGGIFAFSTTDTKNTPGPNTLGGIAFKSF